MIVKTGFPQYLESIAIGPNSDFIKTNTSLCEVASNFPTELDLTYKWRDAVRSNDLLNSMRDFAKNFMVDAPDLDAEFVEHYTNKFNKLPPTTRDQLLTEINMSLHLASRTAVRTVPTRNFQPKVPLHQDNNFINNLSYGTQNCESQCNYFRRPNDKIGSLVDFSRYNTIGNSYTSDYEQNSPAPTSIGLNVFNKIPAAIQKTFTTACATIKRTYDLATSKLSDPDQKLGLTKLAEAQTPPDSKGIAYVGSTSASLLSLSLSIHKSGTAKVKSRLQDCYKLHERAHRFNVYDPSMNRAIARDRFFDVKLRSSTGDEYLIVNPVGHMQYAYENNVSVDKVYRPEINAYSDDSVPRKPVPRQRIAVPKLSGTSATYQTTYESKLILQTAILRLDGSTIGFPQTVSGEFAAVAVINSIVSEALGVGPIGPNSVRLMYDRLRADVDRWELIDEYKLAVPGSIILLIAQDGNHKAGIISNTFGTIISNNSLADTPKLTQNSSISEWEKLDNVDIYAFTRRGSLVSSDSKQNAATRGVISDRLLAGIKNFEDSTLQNDINRGYTLPRGNLASQIVIKGGVTYLTAYADYGTWSIGWGSDASSGNELITVEEAENRVRSKIQRHADQIDAVIAELNLKLTEGQRDALISYAYNARSGSAVSIQILRSIKTPSEIANRIRHGITTAGGKVLQGLVQRRNTEATWAEKY